MSPEPTQRIASAADADDPALRSTLAEQPVRGGRACDDGFRIEIGSGYTAGVDEVGRGPWAGPVVAAAVILADAGQMPGLRDSKRLSPKQRMGMALQIRKQSLAWSIAWMLPEAIDQANILQATLLAMRRAVDGLPLRPTQVLVDGNRLPALEQTAQAIVGGDDLVPCIAAASVLAKVFRDRWMEAYEPWYPGYGFAAHKGYGTALHRQALATLGPCALHRRSFAPVRAALEGRR